MHLHLRMSMGDGRLAIVANSADLGIATPLAVLPGLEARVSARLEDALWKMAADISMPSFTVNALARLELDDPFIETSGSLNLTSTYLEDYFIKMEFKKDFSDVESVMGGGIQIQQGDYNNYVANEQTATWIRRNSEATVAHRQSQMQMRCQPLINGEGYA
ncbi:hypothetical protein RR48_13654 [Papilio machaon]|uniref:Uncharacterized protein n=1 Tax=Papilio machaon TaxID=76193 RepID=A0A194RG55_PAPMA|nr:hypothetical protein RR48_13654 [Papilio machaon]